MARQKQIYVRPDLCAGCRICANACSVYHNGAANPRLGAIRIRQDVFERYEFQEICRHCEDPPCLDACMVGCISRDPKTGLVLHDSKRCVGCWMCVMVCPYGAVKRDVVNKVAIKCDQCHDRDRPVCVEVCPTGALVLELREDVQEETFFTEPTVAG
ncbi:4Fe-4S dicluster domain-containing protein [Desulfoscipio gibsoniae]|uniref:Fe-S-cluster-containing hydrogenase subunit n=1 Tax=Desulfoscipio gibsoniae DSM 7213 TaxID=767817 RepID=R4KUD8_9FIRM|nr:4Fe-4S dicluster domain-containing protein [Desulfoscipio gibsoniae]AGL03241.1 Fe-S-cluster-containing hydrogenase subunit [Desulfoscipio gibsoniae DSM 7213]